MEPEKTARKRASKLIKDVVAPAWQPSRDQVLWTLRVALVIVVLLGILTLVGLPFNITLWNWLDLLIVPLVLALGGYLFTRAEDSRTLDQADHRREEDVLQAYLDQMWKLLLDKDLCSTSKANSNSEALTAARVSTLTTLERIHHYPEKKGIIVKFLSECSLLKKQDTVGILEGANLKGAKLEGADLRNANLSGAFLHQADLSGAFLLNADLSDAVLMVANLREANLGGANLREANLSGARLIEANLMRADLRRVNLREADLNGADLSEANLRDADLRGADLSEATLIEAKLGGAGLSEAIGVTNEELDQEAHSLEGATMPDGQNYEDWLKSKDRGEDGKSGRSP